MIHRRPRARLRVLIAEPNRIHCSALRTVLQGCDYEIVAVTVNSFTTLDAARRLRPDVVLVASEAAGADGIAVAITIQQERIAPCIWLTSAIEPETIRRAAAGGVYSILTRPISEAGVMPAIEMARGNWVRTRQAERRLAAMQRQDESRSLVDDAKRVLMSVRGIGEAQAYRILQTGSMNARKPIGVIARAVLTAYTPVPTSVSELSRKGMENEQSKPRQIAI